MAKPGVLFALLLACLAVVVTADDSYCLAAALDLYANFIPTRNCRSARSKTACLATTGYNINTTMTRRASCTWREKKDNGDVLDTTWMFPNGENGGSTGWFDFVQPSEYGEFCSVAHRITLPANATGRYFAATNNYLDYTADFSAVSQCVAGQSLPSTCNAAALADPGLSLGLPRAFPYVNHRLFWWSLLGPGSFEKPILLERIVKKSCASPAVSPYQPYRFISTGAVSVGNNPPTMSGVYGSWGAQNTDYGIILDYVTNTDTYMNSLRFEVSVLSGTTTWPVYGYLIRGEDLIDYTTANCATKDCRTPFRLAPAYCKFERPGSCNKVVNTLKPTVYGYVIFISREIIPLNPFTDGKIINTIYNVDANLKRDAFPGATTTTATTSAITTSALPTAVGGGTTQTATKFGMSIVMPVDLGSQD